jgi:ornithine--oxo-acid transaminase
MEPALFSPTDLEKQYGAHNYSPLAVELTRGEGVFVWDTQGHRYLDMMSAYSAVSFGHSHPFLVDALVQQASRLAITSRAYYSDQLGPFLKRICEVTGLPRALPMNTGAEAVETAIKAARKWAYTVKKVTPGAAEIVVCHGNFAGRTTTIVGFSTEEQYRSGFGPFTPGFVQVPFGDSDALEDAITPNTAAFIVEPIQGEAGIVVPPRGYLARCAEICRRHNVLLICDEVQTGLGRTGRVLASEHDGVIPDGITLGKALGGGLLPVSAFVARKDVMDVFTPGDHGSTFGGNPLAAAVGSAALELLMQDDLCAHAEAMGERLMAGLRDIDTPLISEVRGRGLLIGPRLATARMACEVLLEHGILSKDTHHTVLRFAPPLIITSSQIDEALVAIRRALLQVERSIGLKTTRISDEALAA